MQIDKVHVHVRQANKTIKDYAYQSLSSPLYTPEMVAELNNIGAHQQDVLERIKLLKSQIVKRRISLKLVQDIKGGE